MNIILAALSDTMVGCPHGGFSVTVRGDSCPVLKKEKRRGIMRAMIFCGLLSEDGVRQGYANPVRLFVVFADYSCLVAGAGAGDDRNGLAALC
jgi:hypothetical protein